MTVFIRMQGDLDAAEIEATGEEIIDALNAAARESRHFVAFEKADGQFIAFAIQNINRIEEDVL